MKTSVNKYSVAKPMISPVSKAGSIFSTEPLESPDGEKKKQGCHPGKRHHTEL